MKSFLLVISLFLCTTLGCKKNKPLIDIDQNNSTEKTLKDMPFPFGAAIDARSLRENLAYKNLLIKEYSSITPENAMKFETIHPQENTYNWKDADEIVAFAIANGQRIHGHTLNWFMDQPTWITNYKGDKQAWENLLKTHIQTIVGHFKGKVSSWDVVNEAVTEDGSTLRNSIWVQKLGADYIARAFQYAYEADPSALLFYNDYGQEYGYDNGLKTATILKMVNDLRARGIPIHGIGLQMHTKYTQSDLDIQNAITSATATGLKIHLSELDVSLNPFSDQKLLFTTSLEEMQAAKYKSIVKIYNSIPKNQQYGITTWNVTDADSWIPVWFSKPDWPLPFDKNYKRKLAHQSILDGITK